jgi:hypothetical protein
VGGPGNFIDFGLGHPNSSSKQRLQSIAYEQIPYAAKQGIN